MTREIGRVGKKGEIYPPKSIREKAGIKAGDEVIFDADKGRIEVLKAPSVLESMAKKSLARISFKEFEELTKKVLP